jgi:hypothetical protein
MEEEYTLTELEICVKYVKAIKTCMHEMPREVSEPINAFTTQSELNMWMLLSLLRPFSILIQNMQPQK